MASFESISVPLPILKLKQDIGPSFFLLEQKRPFVHRIASEFRILDKGRLVAGDAISELIDDMVRHHLTAQARSDSLTPARTSLRVQFPFASSSAARRASRLQRPRRASGGDSNHYGQAAGVPLISKLLLMPS